VIFNDEANATGHELPSTFLVEVGPFDLTFEKVGRSPEGFFSKFLENFHAISHPQH
jgi:hypothetical protein